MKKISILCIVGFFLSCSPQPNPEKTSALQKQTKAADAAAARVKSLETERIALQEELDREHNRQAQLDREIHHVEGQKQ